ncbi:thioredoxin [Actinorhabdospora filicis]|uniref:Thioredoxin n=1 Tax=Actinorhabdospora filicis TaxID=1785913 RepID=A0A9W6SQQ3_9ACTN|nr:thioredoxin domain-containing protein [Actinorhabdospora filicis]GLZ80250.1 thioredoxin [Actinorhabdospora filicis]
MILLSDRSYDREILTADLPVLLAFGAPDDGPSRALGGVMAEVEHTLAGKIEVAVVNVPDCPGIVARWGVTRLPTLLLLREGILERVFLGVRPAKRIVADLEPYLAG